LYALGAGAPGVGMARMGFVAAVLAWMAVGMSAATAGPRDLVIGVEELDYYPVYAVQDGEYRGAAREILDAFAKDRGYALTFRPLPIKRLYAELMSGGIDFKFPDNPFWASDQKKGRTLAYSNPVIRYIDGVLIVPQNVGRSPDEVRVLGTVSGFTPFAWMDRIKDGRVQVKENPRMELLLRQVQVGRLDGAYASIAVANYTLEHQLASPGALIFDPRLPHSRDAYMLSSLKRADVLTDFNEWMATNAARIQAIKDRTGAERGLD
jgi:polar amino acid transport system substrate-binding protein